MFSIFPLLIVILFSMLMYEYKMSIVAVFCPLHSTLYTAPSPQPLKPLMVVSMVSTCYFKQIRKKKKEFLYDIMLIQC